MSPNLRSHTFAPFVCTKIPMFFQTFTAEIRCENMAVPLIASIISHARLKMRFCTAMITMHHVSYIRCPGPSVCSFSVIFQTVHIRAYPFVRSCSRSLGLDSSAAGFLVSEHARGALIPCHPVKHHGSELSASKGVRLCVRRYSDPVRCEDGSYFWRLGQKTAQKPVETAAELPLRTFWKLRNICVSPSSAYPLQFFSRRRTSQCSRADEPAWRA